MYIDKSLARGLAKASLQTYVELAQENWARLEKLGQQAIADEQAGRPLSKVANDLRRKLEIFLSSPGVLGSMHKFSARQAGFVLYLPKWDGQDLHFSVVIGSINGRKPVGMPNAFPLLSVSRHALARLHQRLGTIHSDFVLMELLPALTSALKMEIAAKASEAVRWPLVSRQGMFVTAASVPGPGSTLVTWLPWEGLADKWKRLIDELKALPGYESLWLNSQEQCTRVLKRHDWLRQHHAPADQDEAAWGSRD